MAQATLEQVVDGMITNSGGTSQTTTEPLLVFKVAGSNTQGVVLEVDPSALPAGAVITKVEVTYDLVVITGGGTINFIDMEAIRLSDGAAAVWAQLEAGDTYTSHGDPSTGTFTRDLGASAVLDLQEKFDTAAGYYCLGWQYALGGGTRQTQVDNDAVLNVTYTAPGPPLGALARNRFSNLEGLGGLNG